MKSFSIFLLSAMLAVTAFAGRDRILIYDTEEMPDWFPHNNPQNVLVHLYCEKYPVLDHTGQPHDHGHVIQVIQDGGNGLQDPPNTDGSPGGDDSLAWGNFNMIRLGGIAMPPLEEGKTGQFYSQKLFIAFDPDGAYYLRVWEGDDVSTAPYYQNSVEYWTDQDHGGAMMRITPNELADSDWRFGKSIPRPKSE